MPLVILLIVFILCIAIAIYKKKIKGVHPNVKVTTPIQTTGAIEPAFTADSLRVNVGFDCVEHRTKHNAEFQKEVFKAP